MKKQMSKNPVTVGGRTPKSTLLCWIGVLAASLNSYAAITTVDTVALLQAVNPATFDTVQVVDYYAAVPGNYLDRGRGGGLFKWSTSPLVDVNGVSIHDGGRYIKHNTLTNGIWERQFQGDTPNVKMWGAVGNGITDDTVSIQKAMASIRGPKIGANRAMANAMFFPAGLYRISDTIEINSAAHVRGEGSANSSVIIMAPSVVNKDIFRTADATAYLVGGLTPNGNGTMQNSAGKTVDLATGLLIENLSLQFGETLTDFYRANVTGSGIVLTGPNETTEIRNVLFFGGGAGVRVLSGGTPGLKANNLGCFYQASAGIQIEGPVFTTGAVGANAGPMTLNSISGDSFSTTQTPVNSLILFSNCAPNVTINDLSAEGQYGKGIVRCIIPNDTSGITYSGIAIRGGAFNCSTIVAGEQNLVVLETTSTSIAKVPVITIDPLRVYGVVNLIWDKWQGRKIPAATYYNQMPVRRPIYYTSAITGVALEKRSLLVVGDTAYYSFIPTSTGWHRVAQNYGAEQTTGGRLAVNTLYESSEFTFNLSPLSSDIQTQRKTKNSGGNIVTHARGYCWWNGNGYSQGLDIYVAAIPSVSWPTEQRYITVTLPIEGRTELSSGLSAMRDPLFTGSNVLDTYPNPAIAGENYAIGGNTPTGPVSLLR